MIFDNNFDKTLCLIIKGDRKNGKKIVEFIKSIPYEFILMVREGLVEYERYKIENERLSLDDRENKCFGEQIYNNIGELYSFNIDVKNDMLSITKSVYISGAYYRNFSIKLININDDKNKSMITEIGSLCYAVDWVRNMKEIDYGMMNIGLTNVLVSSSNNDVYKLCGVVDLSKNFELNLEKANGRLVKTKRMDNRKDNKNV